MDRPYTNPEVANRVGISPSAASRLRSGDRRPSVIVASRILSEFVPLDRWSEGMGAFEASGEAQVAFLTSVLGPSQPPVAAQ